MNNLQPADVLVTHSGGKNRYVRLCQHPGDDPHSHHVQDCDAAGFLLNGSVRPLRITTLTNRYRLHYRAQENA